VTDPLVKYNGMRIGDIVLIQESNSTSGLVTEYAMVV